MGGDGSSPWQVVKVGPAGAELAGPATVPRAFPGYLTRLGPVIFLQHRTPHALPIMSVPGLVLSCHLQERSLTTSSTLVAQTGACLLHTHLPKKKIIVGLLASADPPLLPIMTCPALELWAHL